MHGGGGGGGFSLVVSTSPARQQSANGSHEMASSQCMKQVSVALETSSAAENNCLERSEAQLQFLDQSFV